MRYTKVRLRSYGSKGFRLNSKKFTVHRLRTKFLNFFRILIGTWSGSSSYKTRTTSKRNDAIKRRDLVAMENCPRINDSRLKSFTRSNSFYSDAIADCIEFIKRSSASLDDKP